MEGYHIIYFFVAAFVFFEPFFVFFDLSFWLFMIAEARLKINILRSFLDFVLFNVFLIERRVDLGSFLIETRTSWFAGVLTVPFFL